MAIVLVEKGKAEVDHGAGDPRGDRRRPRADQRPDEHARSERHRAPDARRARSRAPMEIVEERTVGPSLGKENIDKGFNSVLYGFIVLASSSARTTC